MNLVEKCGLIIVGPYTSLTTYTGDLVWVFAVAHTAFGSPLLCFFSLASGNLIINLWQLQTTTAVINPVFGKLNEDTFNNINRKIARDQLHRATPHLVTNLSMLNAYCYRNLTKCEIIVSHHWFELPNGPEHLESILEHEFAHARAHHVLKRCLFASKVFCAGVGAFLYLMSLNLFIDFSDPSLMYLGNFLIAFCIFRVTTFLQAWYHRSQEFEADAMALTYTTPTKQVACLTFMREHNPGEKILENIPEWARASHPYIASRIKKLMPR